MSKMM